MKIERFSVVFCGFLANNPGNFFFVKLGTVFANTMTGAVYGGVLPRRFVAAGGITKGGE
jgi:hypothetical protein